MSSSKVLQTPGYVTNVDTKGNIIQTPVMVTNYVGSACNAVSSSTLNRAECATATTGCYNTGARVSALVQPTESATLTGTCANTITSASYAPLTMTSSVVGASGTSSALGGSNYQIIPAPPCPAAISRVQRIPVEQRTMEYQTREWIQTVPRQKTVTEFQERRWTEKVPREITRTEQYAIEYIREYIPEVVATKEVELIPIERIIQRTEYYPVEKRIEHGVQERTRTDAGRVVSVGEPMNHTVVSLGVTEGATEVSVGAPQPAVVISTTPGVSCGGGIANGGLSFGPSCNGINANQHLSSYASNSFAKTPSVVRSMHGSIRASQNPIYVTSTI